MNLEVIALSSSLMVAVWCYVTDWLGDVVVNGLGS